jgi:hypothetical protein
LLALNPPNSWSAKGAESGATNSMLNSLVRLESQVYPDILIIVKFVARLN